MNRTTIAGLHPVTGQPIYVREAKADTPVVSSGKAARPPAATVDAEGSFVAVFSTFDVIDHDGDVTLPGAFAHMEGRSVPVSAYGHGSWQGGAGATPIGSGVIRSTPTHAEVHGHLLLDTEAGRHMHSVLKDGGSELSYGFNVDQYADGTKDGQRVRFLKKVTPFEVSFVLKGAGVGTGVLALDGELAGLSPKAREAVVEFRRLEARLKYRDRRGDRVTAEPGKVSGYKVPAALRGK